jgi:hypothetical protein
MVKLPRYAHSQPLEKLSRRNVWLAICLRIHCWAADFLGLALFSSPLIKGERHNT